MINQCYSLLGPVYTGAGVTCDQGNRTTRVAKLDRSHSQAESYDCQSHGLPSLHSKVWIFLKVCVYTEQRLLLRLDHQLESIKSISMSWATPQVEFQYSRWLTESRDIIYSFTILLNSSKESQTFTTTDNVSVVMWVQDFELMCQDIFPKIPLHSHVSINKCLPQYIPVMWLYKAL